MAIALVDGRTGETVSVSPTGNRLNVSSRSDDRIYYISRDNGDVYSANSVDTPSASGEYNFYFKNTSTAQKFYCTAINLTCEDTAVFKISEVTGEAGGIDIVPKNLNLTSGNVAVAECKGNGAVTGLTEKAVIETVPVAPNARNHIQFHDALVLGQQGAIAIEFNKADSFSEVTISILGFYDVE